MRTGSEAIAPSSAARWEIDLSAGARTSPESPRAGSKRMFMGWRSCFHDREAEVGDTASARAACCSPRDPQRHHALAVVLGGREHHVDDVHARARRARARSRRSPRGGSGTGAQLGAPTRRRRRRPARRRAAPRGRRAPARSRRSISARPRPTSHARTSCRRLANSSMPRDQRVAVGQVDVGPDRAVGAGDARRVAEARPDRRQPLGLARAALAAWATSRLASTCGRCETHAISAVVRVGVDRGRARAEAAEQPVQPLVEDAGGAAFGRRQVPGGAVEEILARVLDAGRLGAGQRVSADEALVARGLRRAPAWSSRRR